MEKEFSEDLNAFIGDDKPKMMKKRKLNDVLDSDNHSKSFKENSNQGNNNDTVMAQTTKELNEEKLEQKNEKNISLITETKKPAMFAQ